MLSLNQIRPPAVNRLRKPVTAFHTGLISNPMRSYLPALPTARTKLLFRWLILLGVLLFKAAVMPVETTGQVDQKPYVSPPTKPDTFVVDMRRLPASKPWRPGDSIRIVPQGVYPDTSYDSPGRQLNEEKEQQLPGKKKDDGAGSSIRSGSVPENTLKTEADGNDLMSATVTSFQGIPATGFLPPDIVGDVGPDHYIQMVNTDIAIYDKSGTVLVGPSPINSLWAGFGGPCQTGNRGDPIVQYDPIADRWLVSQFGFNVDGGGNPVPPFFECICISRTPDPVAGGWYRYGFETPAFPDYPQIGVWPDGYYMSTYEGPSLGVFAFDRQNMLAGLAASYVRFTIPALGAGRSRTRILPADLDGAVQPPAGAPNLFVRSIDGAHQSGGEDRLALYEFHADFAAPALSSFINTTSLATDPYDIEMCGPGLPRNCIPQPGTGQGLDPLSNRLMRRLQYRNFGSYETLVVNQSVDANGSDLAGIRWYELRRASGVWSVQQQGTHSPDNTVNRWMGSIAMNGNGDMALGYSVSSRTAFPGIRYAGRTALDPPGTLDGEVTIMNGGGSQLHASARWGDYSSMNVDPVDDCTFWFTTQYYDVTSSAGWKTLISKIQNPLCGKTFNYMYAAKIVCGTQPKPDNLRLARGVYSTAINIHNPANYNVEFFKKLALTYPPDAQKQGLIYPIAIDTLGPDGALEVDCIDLQRKLFPKGFPTGYIKGFVVLESPEPLDVTGVYTAAKPRGFLCPQKVTSIDVEQIQERKLGGGKPPKDECADLVVQKIEQPGVNCPGGGGTCVTTITFTVANTGAANAGAFNIRIEADPGVVINQAVPGGLAAGATLTFTVMSPPGGNCYNPDCTITITVDIDGAVKECDETNNKRTETTIG